MSKPLLIVDNLSVAFKTDDGVLRAVDGVSLTVSRGEILGIVGESGCGKSAFSMSIPRLLPMPPAIVAADKLELDGINLSALSDKEMCRVRGGKIGVVFQEPMTALSPLHRIGAQISEAVLLHRDMPRRAVNALVLDWLEKVGIEDPVRTAAAWPHELSGGMQQRIMIAMALVNDPDLVIADEPTTALDVTTQAQVLKLMRKLKSEKSGLLLITHDMGVISEMATHVAVMYAGQIVETASCEEIFTNPSHPYTRALLAALPSAATRGKRLPVIAGSVPSPFERPVGCRFSNRCICAKKVCVGSVPSLLEVSDGHYVRCPFAGGVA